MAANLRVIKRELNLICSCQSVQSQMNYKAAKQSC
nr:MAG TPA: hypothetical protein [Caudoviricetes sp.]